MLGETWFGSLLPSSDGRETNYIIVLLNLDTISHHVTPGMRFDE